MDPTGDRTHLLGDRFPPVLCCVLAGQIGILLLLAFTLFLYLHESHPLLAGAALSFCLAKPHLVALPLLVLLLWSAIRRRFQILVGGAVTLLVSSLLPLYFDGHIWSHYLAGVRGEHIENEFIPVLSCVFRMADSPQLADAPSSCPCSVDSLGCRCTSGGGAIPGSGFATGLF